MTQQPNFTQNMAILKPISGDPSAPQQHKQPSRKGKKAWRKNVDVTDVQEGLEEMREEVIQGYERATTFYLS